MYTALPIHDSRVFIEIWTGNYPLGSLKSNKDDLLQSKYKIVQKIKYSNVWILFQVKIKQGKIKYIRMMSLMSVFF